MASSPAPYMNADQVRDLNALMSWLRTFPRIEDKYDECQDVLSLLDDKEMATALLFVADEICDVKVACESCKKDTETIWETISTMICTKMPQVASHVTNITQVSTPELRTFLLSSLVCFAVSESCIHRRTYIERIMTLPSHCQQVLMMIIEKGQAVGSPPPAAASEAASEEDFKATPRRSSGSKRNLDETDDSKETPSQPSAKRPSFDDDRSDANNTSWAADDSFASASVLPGYTPQRKSGRLSVQSLFSPTTIDSTLENLVNDLRKQNESLQQELKTSQQREAELGQQMEEAQVSFRKEMMKLESASMQREQDALEVHQEETAALRQEVEQLKKALEAEQSAHKELESVRDEMDLLQHTKKKLAESEEKLRLCRERIEQLMDVKEALTREEEAHGASVEECLRLQNELKALQPLRRQLEDYKTRAVEAEVKLSECEAELKRMEQVTGNLSSAQKEILANAKIHKEEAEELRRRLLQDEEESQEGPGVGEGLSELNPEIMEEMARLRNENIQLKAFAEAREDDAVQLLNERLDDSQRLSNRFKDQYLSTKAELEETEQKLQVSQDEVAILTKNVQDLTVTLESLEHELEDCKTHLSKSQGDLSQTTQLLEESKGREEALKIDVENLTKELTEANDLASHRLEQLESTQSELDDTASSLKASQEQEELLQKEVVEWTEKTGAAETALSECQGKLEETKQSLDEANSSLNASLTREAVLKGTATDLAKSNQELQEKIDEGVRSTEAALLAAETKLEETRNSLEEKARVELEQVMAELNTLIETERNTMEQKLAAASEEYSQLEEKAARELAQLEEKFNTDLQQAMDESQQTQEQLREQYEQEIASVKQAAEEEREKLIQKGKGMLKECKAKAKEEVALVEDQLQSVEEELADLRQKAEAYEAKTKKQIREYKKKINAASTRIQGLSESNDTMEDSIRDLERERFKLLEENERFRRQLGGRFGADGKVQNQLETLRNEFDAILEENRGLKKEIGKMGNPPPNGLLSITESSETDATPSSYTRGGVSGSTLSQMRKEYDETIDELNDAKRELVMKHTAAMTDVQKAEQRAWESEKQVQTLKEELTSLKLKLQRLQQTSEGSDEFHDAACDSFETNENVLSQEETRLSRAEEVVVQSKSDEMLLDLNSSDDKPMPLVESTNESRDDSNYKPKVNAYDFPPAHEVKRRASPTNERELLKPVPSLMETAMMSSQNSVPDDAQPECKQS